MLLSELPIPSSSVSIVTEWRRALDTGNDTGRVRVGLYERGGREPPLDDEPRSLPRFRSDPDNPNRVPDHVDRMAGRVGGGASIANGLSKDNFGMDSLLIEDAALATIELAGLP